jgi:hypothetical protein
MVMKPGIPKKETEIWHTLLPLVFQANPVLYQKQQHTPIARTTKNASSNQFFQTLENSKCCAASFLERRARRGPSSAPISPKWAPRQSVNAHLERLTLIYSFQIITKIDSFQWAPNLCDRRPIHAKKKKKKKKREKMHPTYTHSLTHRNQNRFRCHVRMNTDKKCDNAGLKK